MRHDMPQSTSRGRHSSLRTAGLGLYQGGGVHTSPVKALELPLR
jgi:hypothetical protein